MLPTVHMFSYPIKIDNPTKKVLHVLRALSSVIYSNLRVGHHSLLVSIRARQKRTGVFGFRLLFSTTRETQNMILGQTKVDLGSTLLCHCAYHPMIKCVVGANTSPRFLLGEINLHTQNHSMQKFPRLAYGDFLVEGKLIGIREIGSESNIGKRLKRESQTIKKSCFIYGHITMGGRYQSVLLLIHEKMDLARPF